MSKDEKYNVDSDERAGYETNRSDEILYEYNSRESGSKINQSYDSLTDLKEITEKKEYDNASPSSKLMKGNMLDLSRAEPKDLYIHGENQGGIQEEGIEVIFDLPDGSQGEGANVN